MGLFTPRNTQLEHPKHSHISSFSLIRSHSIVAYSLTECWDILTWHRFYPPKILSYFIFIFYLQYPAQYIIGYAVEQEHAPIRTHFIFFIPLWYFFLCRCFWEQWKIWSPKFRLWGCFNSKKCTGDVRHMYLRSRTRVKVFKYHTGPKFYHFPYYMRRGKEKKERGGLEDGIDDRGWTW
jgi:hypothetical protein